MARLAGVARRAESLLGTPAVSTAPVPGGDICTATRLRLADGRVVFAKTRSHAPPDFFSAEARGLAWLGQAGGVAVPEVLAVEEDCLVLPWVEPGRPTPEAAEAFGRALAATHRAGAPCFGLADGDGYIGALPMPNRTAETWPEWFATRRVLPYLRLARDRGAVTTEDARTVEAVVGRVAELAGPAEPPARLHGDLWSGNVIWGRDGAVRLVDPAAYGGHRETDLAMLALFGLPQLQRVLAAYQEAAPLAEGWADRVGLHQLFPLLVHAAQAGGGVAYGARAVAVARSLL